MLERLVHLLLRFFDTSLRLGQRVHVLRGRQTELVPEFVDTFLEFVLGEIKPGQRFALARLGGGGRGLLQINLRALHRLRSAREMRRGGGHQSLGLLLKRERVLVERGLCGRCLFRRFRFRRRAQRLLRRHELNALLLFDDRDEAFKHLLDLREVFLGLLQRGDVLRELLLGALQGVDGGLLGGRVVLFLRERVLGLLHLTGRLANRLRGFRRRTGRARLKLLRRIFQLALLGRFGGKLLAVGGSGLLLVGLLFLDQFANLLLQFAERRQRVLRLLFDFLGFGELFLQGAPCALHLRDGFLLFRGSVEHALLDVVVGAEAGAGLLHLVRGRTQILGGDGRERVDVAADEIRVVHHRSLVGRALVGFVALAGLGGFGGETFLGIDGAVEFENGLLQ